MSIAAALAPLVAVAAATAPLNFSDLNLSPIALDLGFFKIRWYSLGYIAAILGGWWYLNRLLAYPGAPMAKRHTDDLILNATLGIILGGRLGYALFYKPSMFANPLELLKLWEGGMAFHGGLIGLLVGIWLLTWRNRLSMLRVADYVTVVAPLGPLFVRPANFINGELWGRVSDVPWAIVFSSTGGGPLPRHPSQLYEMALEGAVLLLIMAYAFFRTDARYYPGRLLGIGMLFYGAARTVIETVREPDAGLENLSWGLTMGQTLSVPMILLGIWLIATSTARRVRVEAVGGTASVA